MKIPALLIALALAGGTALAQAPAGSAKMSGDSTASTAAPVEKAQAPAKVHKKKVVHKKSEKKVEKHASAHHATHAMGAGAAMPSTDLNAGARQKRIDQAYADWRARQR